MTVPATARALPFVVAPQGPDHPTGMQYQLLGPLRVLSRGQVLSINRRMLQTVLTILLLHADTVIPTEQLAAETWGDRQPRRANAAVHVYVSQLRKLLPAMSGPDGPIRTQTPGYQLTVGNDRVDLLEFRQLRAEGRQAAHRGELHCAAARFQAALDLWRGPALESLRDSPAIRETVFRLEEERRECAELLADASLALGLHRDLVGFLQVMTVEHPLHEPFYRQLMLALFRSERQAEALRVYQDARVTIRHELGLEPGRALRDIHQAILTDDRLTYTGAAN